jgi:hypothetical protein
MSAPTLRIAPRKGGAPPTERDGRLVLQGERGWIVSGEPGPIAEARAALGALCEPVGQSVLLVSFGNTVGRINVPGLGVIEVVSGKWDEQHFERMLADLSAVATELPFTADQPTGFPYDRSVLAREEIRYHLFVYLRHILSPAAPADQRLAPALQAVLQRPVQRFEGTRREVPLGAAQRIDQRSLLDIAAGSGCLMRAETPAARHTPIALALGGHLPRTVNERQIAHSHDTPENRFVKSFLQLCGGVIEGMRRALETGKPKDAFQQRIRDECATLEQALAPFVLHPLWREVGALQHLPASSTVLQGRRGYREIYRHFVRLRLAAQIPLDQDELRDLLEAKDIAHLYEIWCYFTAVRLVQELLGPPAHAERPKPSGLQLTVPHELEVRWAGGVRLRYNPRYSPGAGAGRSYSVPLRPDIALHTGGPSPRTHLFDAKFRLEQLGSVLPAGAEAAPADEEDEASAERRGIFKRGDIYKMHTYRDALSGTRSVWVLYPGTESRMYCADGRRLELPAQPIPPEAEGVGGLSLRPEDGGDAVFRRILTQLLGHLAR